MIGDVIVLDTILSKINIILRKNGRSVLLLINNAGCHPPDLVQKYSNIRIVFLPANTHLSIAAP